LLTKSKALRTDISFIVHNKTGLELNKFYYEENNDLIKETIKPRTQYYMNVMMVGKSYLGNERHFRCIQYPNVSIYNDVLSYVDYYYRVIISPEIDIYYKILSTIKIFYWLSTTVLYARGSASIAEIISIGLLRYIFDNNNFTIVKKENTFPDIEAMLEPDEDYYVSVFLKQFTFTPVDSLTAFEQEYKDRRNKYCKTFDNDHNNCTNNNCWYYKDTNNCKIKYT
jgi:hypothetical protein